MRLRTGHPRSLLVIAPHPDDETIGAHGLMARLRRRGVAVRIVMVSDGHASHLGSPTWPRHRLVRERRRETLRAVRRIGVGAGEVIFLDCPDGQLDAASAAVRSGIARALRRAPRPTLVVAPSSNDDHPDHRVVAACVAAARGPGVRRLSYPVWPAGSAQRRTRALVLTTQERLAKRHAIRSYRTQTGRITDAPAGFAMTRQQIAAFSRPQELFVEQRR